MNIDPSVADLHTKVSGMRPPQQDQILSFLHMFSPKSACVGGWRPLQRGLAPPPTGNPGSAPAHALTSDGVLIAATPVAKGPTIPSLYACTDGGI